MVPFGVLDKGQDGETYYAVGGYAVAKGGVTELRLYNPVSMEFDRTLAAVQGTVRSIAVRHDGGKTEELFMLCDTGDGGNRIRSTTWSPARSGSWTEPSPAPKSYWPDSMSEIPDG